MKDMDLQKDDIIDYAMPLLNIESMAREIHDLCLEHKYGEAQEVARRLNAETRVLVHTLHIMEEKEQHAYPKIVQAQQHPVSGQAD
jgi:hypothetical protein